MADTKTRGIKKRTTKKQGSHGRPKKIVRTCSEGTKLAGRPREVNNSSVRLTTEQLKELCQQAERLHFSHGPNAQFWEDCHPEGPHVVWVWMVHRPNYRLWSDEYVQAMGWDFSYNGGVNIRAMLDARMKDGSTIVLKCDFDQNAFSAHL